MITIENYSALFHYAGVTSIIKRRELQEHWLPFSPPKNSFVALKNGEVCGFMSLTLTEDNRGIIEGAITDPSINSEIRNNIMDLLSNEVEKRIKKLNLKSILIISRDKNTIMRAASHGASILDMAVASKYYS